MSINSRIVGFFFLYSLLIVLSFSCKNAPDVSENGEQVRTPVTVTPVTYKKVTSAIDLPAISKFMNKSVIRATTAGVISKISIKQGEIVNAGRLLFTIRTREAMAIDKSSVIDSTLSFNGIIAILSHENGYINSISYQEGDFVQEGDELAVISGQNSLVFLLEVPFELEPYVSTNRNCTLVLPGMNKIDGIITGKLPDMDIQTQTVSYVIRPSSSGHLPGNLIATVSLIKYVNDHAVVLPKEAVLGNETQTLFWVMKLVNDSMAVRVNIKKGYEDNREIEITEPVFTGSDRIILTGNYGLTDTAMVKIIN